MIEHLKPDPNTQPSKLKKGPEAVPVQAYVRAPGSVAERLRRVDQDLSWGSIPSGVYQATRRAVISAGPNFGLR